LAFWEKGKIFEKSVKNPPISPLNKKGRPKDYVFYDGPPFGTGEPHYGHILSSVSKDVVPRYWTMKGYRVERKWGWDCHGLPIENIIEADMKISGKKQIEQMGIAKFNEACRARVLEYADIWDGMIKRIGRWVDFKNSYKTMDLSFMESVWWGFKELWNKGLIYEGRKVLLYCPRCETPISNFEVAMDNSYKNVTDETLYVKFKLTNAKEKLGIDGDAYLLAWTTTPWTLPSNVAMAVGEDILYTALRIKDIPELLIIASDRINNVFKNQEIEVAHKDIKGKDLLNLEYEPLLDVLLPEEEKNKKAYYVVPGDFVTTEDGTGIVHIAPVYGEDDYKVGQKFNLPIIPTLDEKGHFTQAVPEFQNLYFKKANNLIIESLEKNEKIFKKEKITHSYPHCHRCETALFYNAIPAWFLNIDKIRKRMLELNEKINWFPEYLKYGRFAKGIEQAPDWNISRNRYFATPIPIWRCSECEDLEVIGSVAELKEKTGAKEINDIHNHNIDQYEWKCGKCGGKMQRIKEVFDCWVESGSMPFAQMHYPFENKEKFEKNFPAQFISEYISQTRAWFYVMHALAAGLFNSNSFENVVTTGVILNEKGEKMSKSKKNYPDPYKIINSYGADALRCYLMGSTVMRAENILFNEEEVKDIFRKNIMLLWNVYKFYEMFKEDIPLTRGKKEVDSNGATNNPPLPPLSRGRQDNTLDQWILARLNELIKETTESMDGYDLPRAIRPITSFIDDLSTWYLRRSRDRFKGDDEDDKQAALKTTKFILTELAKVMAPFMPFIAETIWQKTTGYNFQNENKSVHLEAWPEQGIKNKEQEIKILAEMEMIRKIVEMGLAKREEIGIKIRQPLNELRIMNYELRMEYINLVKDELNVKNIFNKKGDGEIIVELDAEINEKLKLEGVKRELVRFINALRKDAGMTIKNKAEIFYETESELVKKAIAEYEKEILRDTLSDKITGGIKGARIKKEVKIEGEAVILGIKNIIKIYF